MPYRDFLQRSHQKMTRYDANEPEEAAKIAGSYITQDTCCVFTSLKKCCDIPFIPVHKLLMYDHLGKLLDFTSPKVMFQPLVQKRRQSLNQSVVGPRVFSPLGVTACYRGFGFFTAGVKCMRK